MSGNLADTAYPFVLCMTGALLVVLPLAAEGQGRSGDERDNGAAVQVEISALVEPHGHAGGGHHFG